MVKIHSVSGLTRYIKDMFRREAALRSLSVSGELSNFRRYASGHCYFTLKDSQACLKCVHFSGNARALRFHPSDGMKVVVSGTISVYERDGVYQMYAEKMTPDGMGDLALAFEQLKERLGREGFFAQEKKKRLPVYPRTIGIVTSPSGAVLRDLHRVIKQRNPRIQMVLFPVKVQGEGAARQIAHGIEILDRRGVDLIIVGRGGGSPEDLWAFNEEIVVRAIHSAHTPLISAVGHETDVSLSDFAADLRAATPSHAAELAVPDHRELRKAVASFVNRIDRNVQNGLHLRRVQLQALLSKRVFQEPAILFADFRQTVDSKARDLRRNYEKWTGQRRAAVGVALEQLDLLNPAAVLRRGYAIAESGDVILRSVKEISAGDRIRLRFADGSCRATVESEEKETENAQKEGTFL